MIRAIVSCAVLAAVAGTAMAEPEVTRLNPPSRLFESGSMQGPITARFLPGQRFDLNATIAPDAGQAIVTAFFTVNGVVQNAPVSLVAANAAGVPAGSVCVYQRAFSATQPGVYTFSVTAVQDNGAVVSATGNFEIVGIQQQGRRAKNVIYLIGDGMGVAHRTAARLMRHGVTQGKSDGRLAMDTMPVTGLVTTHSLNSIITDSSPGAACYATGNKSNNNQQGVFPDDTTANFDNPRVELMGEYLYRTQGKTLGIVTTADVFDATPGSFGTHTANRGAGTGICDQYFDDRDLTGLRVLLGGGRKWFLPQGTLGSARASSSDYVLPQDLVDAWGAAPGAIDTSRDLIADFQGDGWYYAPNATKLNSLPDGTGKLIGLFSFSNMNVAYDKINGRRGSSSVVNDYGFPDQPMLSEMTEAALTVLNRNRNGFTLMIEAASIDKQAHNMDSERWILDTLEFDDAIQVCLDFAAKNPDTLVIVTADHECAGVNIIGGSLVTNTDLQARAQAGGGAGSLRNPVVGVYESAGFPRYDIAADGYPVSTNPDFKMLVGYAGNADRYEDWLTNVRPNRDGQQPLNGQPPLNTYPNGPLAQDVAGGFLITGQVPGSTAVHTGSDIPLSAAGRGSSLFTGVMDNTDVYFKAMQAVLGGAKQ